jgi:hypothetical protein
MWTELLVTGRLTSFCVRFFINELQNGTQKLCIFLFPLLFFFFFLIFLLLHLLFPSLSRSIFPFHFFTLPILFHPLGLPVNEFSLSNVRDMEAFGMMPAFHLIMITLQCAQFAVHIITFMKIMTESW